MTEIRPLVVPFLNSFIASRTTQIRRLHVEMKRDFTISRFMLEIVRLFAQVFSPFHILIEDIGQVYILAF